MTRRVRGAATASDCYARIAHCSLDENNYLDRHGCVCQSKDQDQEKANLGEEMAEIGDSGDDFELEG